MHNVSPSQGYHFKRWKAKQALYHAFNCNTPCRDKNDKYYGIQHGLKKGFDLHRDISATCFWSQDHVKSQATKTWYVVGIFAYDVRATTNGNMVDRVPSYTLFDIGTYKAMLNKKSYDEHPILHQYPKYTINIQPFQVANDQLLTVKEASNF